MLNENDLETDNVQSFELQTCYTCNILPLSVLNATPFKQGCEWAQALVVLIDLLKKEVIRLLLPVIISVVSPTPTPTPHPHPAENPIHNFALSNFKLYYKIYDIATSVKRPLI